MKLVLAIVSNDDSAAVSSALTRNGFQVTKLATTGGCGDVLRVPGTGHCGRRYCVCPER